MIVCKKEINFSDHRGEIRDIIDGVEVNSVTLITSKKGTVRANHYHKHTVQYLYLIEGKMEYFTQQEDKEIEKIVLDKGSFVETPQNVKHAFRALEDSIFIACCSGLRAGKQYEEDTFRLEKPISD